MSEERKPVLIAVAGPKGGVGKSCLALNLAAALAGSGREVVLVDLDLGGANLHVLMGLTGLKSGLAGFINDQAELADQLHPTPVSGLRLLPGSSDALGLANLLQWQKVKLINHLKTLPAEVVLADLGSGSTYNTLDFFGAADLGLLVLTPELTSALNVYSFVKSLVLRKLQGVLKPKKFKAAKDRLEQALQGPDPLKSGLPGLIEEVAVLDGRAAGLMGETVEGLNPGLILNMMDHPGQAKVAQALDRLARRRLGLGLELRGRVPFDPRLRLSVSRMKPLLPDHPDSPSATALAALAADLGPLIERV